MILDFAYETRVCHSKSISQKINRFKIDLAIVNSILPSSVYSSWTFSTDVTPQIFPNNVAKHKHLDNNFKQHPGRFLLCNYSLETIIANPSILKFKPIHLSKNHTSHTKNTSKETQSHEEEMQTCLGSPSMPKTKIKLLHQYETTLITLTFVSLLGTM